MDKGFENHILVRTFLEGNSRTKQGAITVKSCKQYILFSG